MSGGLWRGAIETQCKTQCKTPCKNAMQIFAWRFCIAFCIASSCGIFQWWICQPKPESHMFAISDQFPRISGGPMGLREEPITRLMQCRAQCKTQCRTQCKHLHGVFPKIPDSDSHGISTCHAKAMKTGLLQSITINTYR